MRPANRDFAIRLALFALTLIPLQDRFVLAGPAEDPNDDVKQIIARWESMSQAVATSNLHCRHLIVAVSPKHLERSKTRDDFNRFLHERLIPLVDSVDAASQMRQVTADFLGTDQSLEGLAWNWSALEIIGDGATLRNDAVFATPHSDKPVTRTRVRSKDDEVDFDSLVNQAMIKDGQSQIRMHTYETVCFVPRMQRFLHDKDLALKRSEAGRSILKMREYEIEFDSGTGFVYHANWTRKDGHVLYDTWQSLPKRVAGGGEVPGISAKINYRRDAGGESRVLLADIFVIESVQLNEEIRQDAFQVHFPKGTTVVNQTAGHLQDTSTALEAMQAPSEVTDIRAFAAEMRLPGPPPQQAPSRLWPYLTFVNVAAILVLAYWSYYRRKKQGRMS